MLIWLYMICVSILSLAVMAQEKNTFCPIFTGAINEPSNRAVDFIIEQAKSTEGTPLQFEEISIPFNDFCKNLKEHETGIYISILSYYQKCFPEMKSLGAFDFPFIAKDWADARRVINGPTGLVVSKSLKELGIQVMNFWDGETRVLSSNTAIASAEDLNGKKVLGPRTFASTTVIEQNGGSQVQLPAAEVMLALDAGIVDTADVSLSFYAKALTQVQGSVLLSNHSFDPVVVATPSHTLQSLGAIQLGLIESLIRQATSYQIRQARFAKNQDLASLKERGVNVVMMSEMIRDSFRAEGLSQASSENATLVFSAVSPPLKTASKDQVEGQLIAPYWKVFFATNRKAINKKFTENISERLLYGQAEVELDTDQPVNSPAELIEEMIQFAIEGNGVVVDWNQVSNSPFPKGFTRVRRVVPTKAPLIYVHGFANTFDDALRRAAWVGWNAKRPAIAFIWPSYGEASLLSYKEDKKTADKSLSALALLLEEIGRDYDARTDVDIVLHSMGARVLLGALDTLTKKDFPAKPPRFRQLVLVAPDIASTKLHQDWPQLAKYFEKEATLYVSDHDKALGISRNIMNRQEGPRAGLAPPVLVEKGIESIFIGPNDFSFTGHSYHVENGIIADDIFEVLRYGTSAQDRRGSWPSQSGQGYYELRRLKNL